MSRRKARARRSPNAVPEPERIPAAHPAQSGQPYPGWRWRTFPVFAALVVGMLIAFVVNEGSVNPVAFALQLLALLGVGYAIAHIIVVNVVLAGRTRRRREAIERGEPDEDDLEDVVVYDDER